MLVPSWVEASVVKVIVSSVDDEMSLVSVSGLASLCVDSSVSGVAAPSLEDVLEDTDAPETELSVKIGLLT